ncbi:MAG: transposase [Chromatiaceae bacterium]
MQAVADWGNAACTGRQNSGRAVGPYQRRRPAETVLYQLVQEHLETFLALNGDGTGEGLPGYVERDFRKYLDCGILARGFARARCTDCGEDFLIAFSCQARGACPSCNTRRMVEIAAHLVDHVIPPVPVRQWVLSLPKRLRGFLHRDPTLAGRVLRIFLEEVERALRRECPDAGEKARTGAVLFPHRFGSSLNAHYHFHACVIEGLYEAEDEGVRFHAVAELSEAAILQVQEQVRRRVLKAFVRWGLLEADARDEMLGWQHGGGFSLDASVRIAAEDTEGLERLLRYCARPPLAAGHLQWVDARHEQLRYQLPKPMADGSAELILPALELLERLSAFIPPPRIHRHRYYAVLAPNAPLRPAVTALATEQTQADSEQATSASAGNGAEEAASEPSPSEEKPRRPAVSLWAMLLARIYELFPLVCPHCGGEVEIISFITEAPTVRAILTHIGEPSEAPPIAPCRGPPEWEMLDQTVEFDPIHPEPEYELDQSLSW